MAKHAPDPDQFSLFEGDPPPPPTPKKIVQFPAKPGSAFVAEAQKIYALYPWKVGKPVAVRAIAAALRKHGFERLRERTAKYALLRGNCVHEFPHVPNPSTWFNQERFNDAEETWMPRAPLTPTPAKQRENAQARMPSNDTPAGWDAFLAKSEFATYRGTFRHAPAFIKTAFAKSRQCPR